MRTNVCRNCLIAVAMLLTLAASVPLTVHQVTAQDDGVSKTINLEIIVDSSGSMAAPTDTGIVRMDAAKAVLTEVISQIPDEAGINVGFRVYGHLGDNTDAGRPESCLSSELLVPMNGVNADRLIARVRRLSPVGWTPIGYSLEQAANDFTQPAGDDVVNVIVMVTDGLETCDADPVAIAGELRNSEAGIVTHVIGFGTTPEEQAILSGIAEAGGGELLGSNNAGQLMSALFSLLEELEVVEETGTGESRNSPLGIGRVGKVGDYDVSVLSVTPNANEIVAGENQFNDPPAPGNQFFMARVAVTYVGTASGTPGAELNFQTVGDLSASYTEFNDSCGVTPESSSNVAELFEGGSAEFNVCWEIDSGDEDSLVMYVESFLDFDSSPVWFSLGNPIAEVVDPDATPVTTETVVEEPTSVPTVEPTESTTEEPSTRTTSRQDPLALGEVGLVGAYELSVVSVTPNANEMVALENQFNDPPAPGNQFFLARVAVTYVGSTRGTPGAELNFQAVGSLSASYTEFNNPCGVFPDASYNVPELFEGGSAEFNVCWQIDSEDQDSLVMYVESFLDFNAEPVWFSLRS